MSRYFTIKGIHDNDDNGIDRAWKEHHHSAKRRFDIKSSLEPIFKPKACKHDKKRNNEEYQDNRPGDSEHLQLTGGLWGRWLPPLRDRVDGDLSDKLGSGFLKLDCAVGAPVEGHGVAVSFPHLQKDCGPYEVENGKKGIHVSQTINECIHQEVDQTNGGRQYQSNGVKTQEREVDSHGLTKILTDCLCKQKNRTQSL